MLNPLDQFHILNHYIMVCFQISHNTEPPDTLKDISRNWFHMEKNAGLKTVECLVLIPTAECYFGFRIAQSISMGPLHFLI